MYWSKLFIPTLREDPAGTQSAAARLLTRAGYIRGRDYLFLGRLTLRRIVGIIREEMDAIGAQEVLIESPILSVAAELRSYRQLPQLWYQFSGFSMKSNWFAPATAPPVMAGGALDRILDRCGVKEPAPAENFPDPEGDFTPEEFHTPGQKSIADLCRFTGLPPTSQMKSLVLIAAGEPILALVRGDHQLNEEKLAWYLDSAHVRAATPGEIRQWFAADAGSLGPVGLKNIRIIADDALRGRRNMICGANRNDYHLRHVTPGQDFPAEFHDIRDDTAPLYRIRQGSCPLQVTNEAAQLVNMSCGAAELFLDRLLIAAVEQHSDSDGLALPPSIAPFAAVITPVNAGDETQRRAATELHEAADFPVLLDDRDERPGVKFKDADLIGAPYRITLGKKLAQGMVELRDRRQRSSFDVPVDEVLAHVRERIK